jgi:hypothetical protein
MGEQGSIHGKVPTSIRTKPKSAEKQTAGPIVIGTPHPGRCSKAIDKPIRPESVQDAHDPPIKNKINTIFNIETGPSDITGWV